MLRPADAGETALAWELGTANSGPTAQVLSRQDLPVLVADGIEYSRRFEARTVLDPPAADVVLAASGSEVGLALTTAERLPATPSRPEWCR